MLTPKLYQLQTVEALAEFLRRSRALGGPAAAFSQLTSERTGVGLPYFNAPGFEAEEFKGMPYVCLRLPTGGGKTLLACLSVPVIQRELMQSGHAVVLWLVPSRAIQSQTIVALRNRTHHYRQALENELGAVEVLDPTEALYVTKATLDASTVVIVSTLQSFRITEKEGRKVYESSGALHHHFAGLDAATQAVLEKNEAGTVPYSLANVLRLQRPIVIVDEAHNARTPLSFDTLARFRPACILELTATPARDESPSNVLYHVSAKQLAAEDMIKLPIRLETRTDWLRLLADAVALREGLEKKAKAEEKVSGEPIRPIVLIKAERKDKDRETRTVEVVEKALIEHCKVPADWIVRATGDDRGLDDIDLFKPDCPVRFVITVDALKEGWDCSWAYVLCSVAEMKSDTAVEQLIGRVLRLPGARRKEAPELNRAYALATSSNFAATARALEDALVAGNGFNPLEAKDLIVTPTGEQGKLELPVSHRAPPMTLPVTEAPDISRWTPDLSAKVKVDAKAGTVTFVAPLTEDEIKQAAEGFLMEASREQFVAAARNHAKVVEQIFTSPAERGVKLAVPVFCVERQGVLEWLDETHFLERPWNLRAQEVLENPGELAVGGDAGAFGSVGLDEAGKVKWKFGDELADELKLIEVTENWTEARLVDWLDRNIPHPDISADETGPFISAVLGGLMAQKEFTLGRLVRERFVLRDHVEAQIDTCRKQAKAEAFQQVIFGEVAGPLRVTAHDVFTFDPDRYPARWMCERSGDFKKHYHRQVGELGDKGEEFECALFLDQLTEVETWVRNLERQPERSFWLPTATDRFYPDFVCKLKDGRILVLEYKGADRWSNDDSKEKRRLGELWANRSGGSCLFAMPKAKDFAVITSLVRKG
ncbi:MAG: DEAD/DEAH box helicase family protein [Opitutaceae bacterium]|jgi:type III restriction enzyme|nr:DEAD/DEAH box helicase family protein [Opitutaceae bacterium]MBP9912962.1 DEAD/DEAH box helicase family protein [Opitutaceae bacterium]